MQTSTETEFAWNRFAAKRDAFVATFKAKRGSGAVRLSKPTSNLFRPRTSGSESALDAGPLDQVIQVDPAAGIVDVEGMATYETIVAATLPFGVMPTVVPQLKTITLGGAVTGIGIESSSFRYGLVHETVTELEILTGTGEVLTARPDNEHAELFYAFPNSYGTLGYALRVQVRVVPVTPYVRLRHIPVADAGEYFALAESVCASGSHEGERVDFVDGTIFGRDDHYLTLASFVDYRPATSDYTGLGIYYRSIPRRRSDHLSIHDYIWRWDTDWFWCSRNFKMQSPLVRPFIPRKYLRSSTYWKILDFEQRTRLAARIGAVLGNPVNEMVIQDVEVPISTAAEFLDFFHEEIGISPAWMCPTRASDPSARWDLYPMDPKMLYVNFGFWAGVAPRPGDRPGDRNRLLEAKVRDLGGSKSLYSTSYYSEDEFRALYNGERYDVLKKTYDPDSRFKTMYEKCVKQG